MHYCRMSWAFAILWVKATRQGLAPFLRLQILCSCYVALCPSWYLSFQIFKELKFGVWGEGALQGQAVVANGLLATGSYSSLR